MDKTVVIYKSKHGSTKKYAEWIGEELECPVLSADDFSKKELEDYENIIFGGCVQAGGIMGFDLIKKNMRRLAGKKLVIFAVGLNIMQKETRMQLREINFNRRKVAHLTCYYCPGAYDPEKIRGIDAGIMKMMVNMLEKKPSLETTEEDRRLLKNVKNGADLTDRKYIEPIIAEFKKA